MNEWLNILSVYNFYLSRFSSMPPSYNNYYEKMLILLKFKKSFL